MILYIRINSAHLMPKYVFIPDTEIKQVDLKTKYTVGRFEG